MLWTINAYTKASVQASSRQALRQCSNTLAVNVELTFMVHGCNDETQPILLANVHWYVRHVIAVKFTVINQFNFCA